MLCVLSVLAAVVCLIAGLLLLLSELINPVRGMMMWQSFSNFTSWMTFGAWIVFAAVGALAALDFDRAFTVFHTLFFPGKDNWLFDWRTDGVILILPEAFFRNCALLIGGLILLWCAALIAADLWIGRRLRKSGP